MLIFFKFFSIYRLFTFFHVTLSSLNIIYIHLSHSMIILLQIENLIIFHIFLINFGNFDHFTCIYFTINYCYLKINFQNKCHFY